MTNNLFPLLALSALAAASYNEDRYGGVQRDVPKILESYIGCIIALERSMDGSTLRDLEAVRGELEPTQVVHRQTLVMLDVLHNCVYELTNTFYETLRVFTFPPVVAHRLEQYLEFRAG
jgi:nucleoporin NDC1